MNIGVILGCNDIKEVKELDKLELVKGLSSPFINSIVNKASLSSPRRQGIQQARKEKGGSGQLD